MPYFQKDLGPLFERLNHWLDVRKEQGADVRPIVRETCRLLDQQARKAERLRPSDLDYEESESLEAIRRARPKGPRRLAYSLSEEELYDKILGALLGRGAGCVLGIPVEGATRQFIEEFAKKVGQPYPLAEFWRDYPGIRVKHYSEYIDSFIQPIDHLGPDDDLVYTVLGLLILEENGLDFTPEDVGQMWLKYLPMACTAEHVALENLKKGLKPPKTAVKGNPFFEWIGADIRSDPWGYVAPGLPELAAEFAWRDARVSHVGNGIYGEMFFSAAIATAFVESDMKKILRTALTEIPQACRMAETVRATMRWCEEDKDWDRTWKRFARKFEGMSGAHTLNNACLTIMGLLYGQGDFERTISYTVMGGCDTDCTGATAGSIAGAILGASRLPAKWTSPFNDTLTTYLIGNERFSISDIARRFCRLALAVRSRFG